MKKVIFRDKPQKTVLFSDLTERSCIFMVKDGKVAGMVVKEPKGWIVRVGGILGCSGHHDTMETCIKDAMELGYTPHVEIELKEVGNGE